MVIQRTILISVAIFAIICIAGTALANAASTPYYCKLGEPKCFCPDGQLPAKLPNGTYYCKMFAFNGKPLSIPKLDLKTTYTTTIRTNNGITTTSLIDELKIAKQQFTYATSLTDPIQKAYETSKLLPYNVTCNRWGTITSYNQVT